MYSQKKAGSVKLEGMKYQEINDTDWCVVLHRMNESIGPRPKGPKRMLAAH